MCRGATRDKNDLGQTGGAARVASRIQGQWKLLLGPRIGAAMTWWVEALVTDTQCAATTPCSLLWARETSGQGAELALKDGHWLQAGTFGASSFP